MDPAAMRRLTLEVIATSVADAEAAERGGADRIELVADLRRGGLTPPLALVEAVLARVRIPVRVMLRESDAHEVEAGELRDRLHDLARHLAALPVDGLVVGFLRRGRIDRGLLTSILAASAPRSATFHRAFEAAGDQDLAVADLKATPGVDRVLTSGGSGAWSARAARLERWARLGGPNLRILVGGGVTEASLEGIAAIPGIREVHVGRAAREPANDQAPVDWSRVAALRRLLEAERGV
jgi:copper homeostasis protein